MTHLKLVGLVELGEAGLHVERLLKGLQEQPLEGHDLPDVAEERIDFGRTQERCTLQGLQVILQEVVQVLQRDTGRDDAGPSRR